MNQLSIDQIHANIHANLSTGFIIMHPLLNIAISAARQAGDIILRHSDQIHKLKIMKKNCGDVFSEVDIKAEQTIIHNILKAYPEHGIIAEETGYHNQDAEFVWIIDPLDGTKNYIHGFPFYSISIAVQRKKKIEHAVILDPIRHECFAASRGAGARLNDNRIRVSKEIVLKDSLIGSSFSMRDAKLSEKFNNFNQKLSQENVNIRTTGSVALDLAYVASGRIDGICALSMKPWDIAAGALLIQEAGGLVSDQIGNEQYMDSGDIIAGNPKIFKQILQNLNMK